MILCCFNYLENVVHRVTVYLEDQEKEERIRGYSVDMGSFWETVKRYANYSLWHLV